MNTPNPLIPQGSLQTRTGRSNVQLAVITIVAIHVVFFGGLLLQGCKRDTKVTESETTGETTTANYTLPQFNSNDLSSMYYTSPTNLPPEASSSATPTRGTQNAQATPSVVDYGVGHAGNTNFQTPTTAAAGEAKEYSVVKGDTYYKIAKDHGITTAALTKANPGVDPARLKVGQKIRVPAAEPKSTMSSTAGGESGEGNGKIYTVQAGDTLTKIAKQHGTTVSALRAANGMKVSRLLVGQKIKIPSGSNAVSSGRSANSSPGTAAPTF